MNRYFIVMAAAAAAWTLYGAPSQAQNAEAGQALFKRDCAICHSPIAGKNGLGPSLFGIVGRSAGTVPNFKYTDANKNSGLTWDTATLDRYLVAPKTAIPKTSMSYMGQKDEQKRHDLLAYLATLH